MRKGISDLHEYDSARLWERYNLKPEQMIDFMGLKGDPSDNIPGVPGIGEKTALKLLHEYGSLDRVLASTPAMKGKLKENLELYRDQALLSGNWPQSDVGLTNLISIGISVCWGGHLIMSG